MSAGARERAFATRAQTRVPGVRERLRRYALLMRLHRPIGIWLLLWPALWALWIAGAGRPDPMVLLVFVAGVILMRSAGCVVNDYADRGFDPHVTRTRDRPLAAGLVQPREALLLFTMLCLLAFALVLLLNRLTVLLSLAGVVLVVSYPFTKRYTHLPQLYLGAAFGWAIPMAFAAQTGKVPPIAWLVFLANVLWSTVYDTMYAMVDREDDLRIGVKSTAILFGHADRMLIGVLQLLLLGTLLLVGTQLQFASPYYLGIGCAALLSGYQQYLIRDREPAACFRAFLNNHWLGMAVFSGIAAEYLLR